MNRISPGVGLVFLLAGCATEKSVELADTRLGDVAVAKLPPAASDHYAEPAAGESYEYPVQFDENAPPVYPENLLAQQLPPVRVKVRVIVDETGVVTNSVPLEADASADPAFFGATQAALRDWKFTPLVRIAAAEGRTEIFFQGVAMTFPGKATALPFHQDYVFTFTQRDGKGFVSTQAPAQP